MYRYNDQFQVLATGSADAARRIIGAVSAIVAPGSVLDVGCARGSWLRAWQEAGCRDIVGVDGPYIDQAALEIDRDRFVVADLNQPLALRRRFDLAECLEVAEHLPPSRAESLIADLASHAPVVLFSAATPGQGGENHINEQPAAYWQALFRRHDFTAVDCLRPLLAGWADVPHWYRYNLLLYVSDAALGQLHGFVRQFAVPHQQPVPDVSPLRYRLRRSVVRMLPQAACNSLARLNARVHAGSVRPN